MHKFRFVIVSVLLLACAAMMANGVAVDGIHYVLDESNQTASVTFTGIDAFRYANDYQGALVIPGAIQYNGKRYSVTSIGTDAFRNSSVSSITLPGSVSSVYYNAFYGCSQLDTLHCRRMKAPTVTGSSVTSFSGIRSGVIVEVPAGAGNNYQSANLWKKLTIVENSSVCGDNLTWRVNAAHDTLWIEGSGAMCDYVAFRDMPWQAYKNDIIHLQLSDEMTHIGAYSFCDMYRLNTIRLPRELQSVGFSAFYDCWCTDAVVWNEKLETIGDQAFADVPMKRWLIPATVRSVGRNAIFSDSLEYIAFQSMTPPAVDAGAFGYDFALPIHVPCEAIPAYRAALSFDFVGADSPKLVVLPNDTLLGSTTVYQYDCDSALLTAVPGALACFRAWSDGCTANPRVLTLEQDCTLTAVFAADRRYRIVFLNSDSTVLEVDSVMYGAMPVYGGATPLMPGVTAGGMVQFKSWYPALQPVTEDATYMARYHYLGTTYDGLCFHSDTVSSIRMTHSYWNDRYPQLQYSEDGRIWYDWDYSTLTMAAGDSLFFRGENPEGIGHYISWLGDAVYSTFGMTGRIRATGNILSIIDTTMTTRRLPDYAFVRLFRDCMSLVEAPEMPVDTVGVSSCFHMFLQSGLSRTPELPAMHLASACYRDMFNGCPYLTEVCELPATELAPSCYMRMFEGCESLRVVQRVLPAEVLEESCYWNMYAYSPLIEVAPEIMAEGLAPKCCIEMFRSCTSLREIRVHFQAWDETEFMNAMSAWVEDVSPVGNFYCPAELEQIADNDHIPTGWLINPASALESAAGRTNTAVKTLHNGQLRIVTQQGTYTATGVRVVNK